MTGTSKVASLNPFPKHFFKSFFHSKKSRKGIGLLAGSTKQWMKTFPKTFFCFCFLCQGAEPEKGDHQSKTKGHCSWVQRLLESPPTDSRGRFLCDALSSR